MVNQQCGLAPQSAEDGLGGNWYRTESSVAYDKDAS
jgi:hypothetical protein